MSEDYNYGEGGVPHYKRGPIIGEDGKYTMPVDVDTLGMDCPFCGKAWPDAPHVALNVEDQLFWVEGWFIYISRRIPVQLLAVLVDSFGRFVSKDQLVNLAFSDAPDADIPGSNSLTSCILYLRKEIAGTRLVIQNKNNHGYRLTTKENADEFNRREREQRDRIKSQQLADKRAKELSELSAERAKLSRRRSRKDKNRDREKMLPAVGKNARRSSKEGRGNSL